MKIIKASERTQSTVKTLIIGRVGVGKTTLASTLPARSTLFIDVEAGTLGLQSSGKWDSDLITIKSWEDMQDVATWIAGVDEMDKNPLSIFSQHNHNRVVSDFGGEFKKQYKTIYIDSLNAISRLCYKFASNHPDTIASNSNRNGFKLYEIINKEMGAVVNALQNQQRCHVVYTGIISKDSKDNFEFTLDGKAPLANVVATVDYIGLLDFYKTGSGESVRDINFSINNNYNISVCKERSGGLITTPQPPNLTKFFQKILKTKTVKNEVKPNEVKPNEVKPTTTKEQ